MDKEKAYTREELVKLINQEIQAEKEKDQDRALRCCCDLLCLTGLTLLPVLFLVGVFAICQWANQRAMEQG